MKYQIEIPGQNVNGGFEMCEPLLPIEELESLKWSVRSLVDLQSRGSGTPMTGRNRTLSPERLTGLSIRTPVTIRGTNFCSPTMTGMGIVRDVGMRC